MSIAQHGERLDVLDGLRGLAIGLVVWYHAWLVSGQSVTLLNFVAEAGFLGVDLFFFISGFCIFYPYARAAQAGRPLPTTRRFFARRAVKILPSYVLAIVVFTLVYHARFASLGEAAIQLVSHLTFLHTFTPLTFGAISGPLWTIGVEVQFYLLFPLLGPLFGKAPVRSFIGLVMFAEAYRVAVSLSGQGSTFLFINQLPAYLDVFGSGMLAAWLFTRLPRPTTTSTRGWYTAASLGAFAVVFAGLAFVAAIARAADINAAYGWVNTARIAIGPLCIVLALSSSFALGQWRALLTAPALVFLSVISYNLYLWNLEIAVWYHQAGLPPLVTFVVSIASALLIATAITYGIERPLLEAGGGALWAAFRSRILSGTRQAGDGSRDISPAA